MAERPKLASDTAGAIAWLEGALPSTRTQTVADWAPASLPAVARIDDLGGDDPDRRQDELQPLIDVLARHTKRPDACNFCIWDGYAWLSSGIMVVLVGRPPDAPAIRPGSGLDFSAVARATFSVPGQASDREYLLWEGPVESVAELGWRGGEVLAREYPDVEWGRPFEPQIPDLMWPADGAWFFGTDTDFEFSFISGSQALIDELSEVWPGVTGVERSDRID